LSQTVRAVEVAADRSLVTVRLPAEDPAPGQVLVDVAYCGICGSDLHFREVPELFPAGTVPGHELSGRISALGPGVEGWTAGDRVCVLPFAQCGECDLCRGGNEQVCPYAVANGVGLGTGRAGGYAERLVVDERMLFSLPDEVDDRAAALVEPLAVAVRAVAKAEVASHEPVAVLGAGTIGLLTGLVLRRQGFERLCVVSRSAARAARAQALGLRTVGLDDATHDVPAALGAAPRCVFECAGTPAAAKLAIELVPPLGRVIMVGISLESLDVSAPPLVLKEVELRGSLTYRRADFQRAIGLLAAGLIPADELITAVVPLEDAEAAFRELVAPGNDHLKVLLKP
jgi:(R,R)-butanediol dehydrogenase / meso-butanediol dehydrogenase / diacetyl reductase